jgi:hypothetical protein
VTTIAELNADQLAEHAANLFAVQGRHRLGARLVFRALELDPRNGLALRCLSDLFDNKGTRPFSAVALEYGLRVSNDAEDSRAALDDQLFVSKWSWGFARHKSGEKELPTEEFSDRSSFRVNERQYKDFLGKVVQPAKSLDNALRAAHTLCGLIGGIVEHKKKGMNVRIADTYAAGQFGRTAEYGKWLETSVDSLNALVVTREEPTPTLAD